MTSATHDPMECNTAFGRAMMAKVTAPSVPLTVTITWDGQVTINDCGTYIEVRPEEAALLTHHLADRVATSVLDIGCGVGRHSILVRSQAPSAAITVVEKDDAMRRYALERTNAIGYRSIEEVPAGSSFDLILLLGNGLGIFGNEEQTREGLKSVLGMVKEGGAAIIESGNPYPSRGFHTASMQVRYGRMVDGPFDWGFADQDWLSAELRRNGFHVNSTVRSAVPGMFCIVSAARKP
jgi:SAM-dependent methyltransferase